MSTELVHFVPTLSSESALLRLDLGCGKTPCSGYEGVDLISSAAEHKVDLFKFPYPWADNTAEAINCSHFIEHIPAREIEERDIRGTNGHRQTEKFLGQDMLFAFFDECYRILIPGGKLVVVAPAATSDRAFQDPTHRRFINQNTFLYMNLEMRKMLEVEHYNVLCDFDYAVVPIVPNEIGLLHPEAAARRFKESWNVVMDWRVDLTSKKKPI